MSDRPDLLPVLIGGMLFLLLAAIFVSQCNDCDSRGGVLVEDSMGLYRCVQKR